MTRLLSYDQASQEYGIPREMLVEAVSNGTLRCIKRGNAWIRFREQTLDRWLEGLDKVGGG